MIEYSACKQAAAKLREICVYGAVFVRPPEKLPINKTFTGTLDVQKLVDAYMGMSEKSRAIKPVRAEQFSPIVATRIVTVTSKIVFVLKKLYRSGECAMSELYEGISDKSARVATFLAVLELTKSGRIFLNDDNSIIKFNRESKRKHNHEPAVTSEISEPQTDPLDELQPEISEPVPEELAADEPIAEPEQIEERVDETPEIADVSDSSPDEPTEITEVFVAPIRECSIPETRRDQHKLAVPVAAIHIESADESKVEEQTEYKNMNIIRPEREEQGAVAPRRCQDNTRRKAQPFRRKMAVDISRKCRQLLDIRKGENVMDVKDLAAHIEAVLFASGEPISLEKLMAALVIPKKDAEDGLAYLTEKYKERDFGIELLRLENSYQLAVKKGIF